MRNHITESKRSSTLRHPAEEEFRRLNINSDNHLATMPTNIEEISLNYEEDGILLVKELDREVLSKGAWTTIIFRYRTWDKGKEEYSKDMYSIRRYQKRQGEYLPKSKFNISSVEQAKKIIETLQRWTADQ
jgi:hypothetical protein